MSETFWGLRDSTYGGTVTFADRQLPATIALRLKSEQLAELEITAAGLPAVLLTFSWTWWEDKQEVWINARELGGVAATSVGALKDRHLTVTITASEPIQALGGTGAVLAIDATESN